MNFYKKAGPTKSLISPHPAMSFVPCRCHILIQQLKGEGRSQRSFVERKSFIFFLTARTNDGRTEDKIRPDLHKPNWNTPLSKHSGQPPQCPLARGLMPMSCLQPVEPPIPFPSIHYHGHCTLRLLLDLICRGDHWESPTSESKAK